MNESRRSKPTRDRRTGSGGNATERAAARREPKPARALLESLFDDEAWLRHGAWVQRLAFAMVGDPHEAQDVAQETWLAAMRKPPREPRAPRAWLRTVARRAASRRRSAETAGALREQRAARPEAIPSTAELAAQAEMQRRVMDEVARLDDPMRRTMLLRYVAGLTAAEIARQEREPSGTVRSRLKRGLDTLRERLGSTEDDRRALAGLATAGGAAAWPVGEVTR